MSLGAFVAPAPGSKPGLQKFEGGDKCGEKPRAAAMRLFCGDAAAVVQAEEPSTCMYALAATHPSLCAPGLGGAFPKWSGFSGGGGGGAAAVAAGGGHGHAHAGLGDGGGEAPLTEDDVAGAGGRTLGVDDRLRHSSRWEGLGELGPDVPSPWVVEAHASDVGAARWRCVAYAADDLRKGTEERGMGGVAVTSGVLEVVGEGGHLRAVSWAARGSGRQALETAAPEEGANGALRLSWRATAEGGAGGQEQQLAFLSIVVEDV
jgi:hypothetical protein